MSGVLYYKPWVVFWICAIAAHGYMDYSFLRRWRSWGRGQRSPEGLSVSGRSLRLWCMEVFLQRQLLALSPGRWVAHLLIFWGFVGLALLSISLFIVSLAAVAGIDGGLAGYLSHGGGHPAVKVWGDFFGLCLMAGLLAAAFRRFVLRPGELSSDQSDALLLILLLWLAVSGFALEALRLSYVPVETARFSFAARVLAPLFPSAVRQSGVLTAAWVVHCFSGLGLLLYLPHSKLMHSLLGPVVIAYNAAGEPGRKDIYWTAAKGHRPTE